MKTSIIVLPLILLFSLPCLADPCSSAALKAAKAEVKKEFPAVASRTRYESKALLLGGTEDGSQGPEADITAFNTDISQQPEDDEGAPTKGRFIVAVPVKYDFNSQGQIENCQVDGTPSIDIGD